MCVLNATRRPTLRQQFIYIRLDTLPNFIVYVRICVRIIAGEPRRPSVRCSFPPSFCGVQPFLLDGDTGHKALMPGVRRTGDNGHKARYQLWLMTMAVAVGLLVLFAATLVEVDIVGREGQQPSGPSMIWQL